MAYTRDTSWGSQWLWEAFWFLIFSGFSISIVVILRPDDSSDMLTEMQEILDETLNEMHTEDMYEADPDVNELFNHDQGAVEMHHFGGRQKDKDIDMERLESEEILHSDL